MCGLADEVVAWRTNGVVLSKAASTVGPDKITVLGVRKNDGPIKLPLPSFAVLDAQMGPDRPNFKSYSHITA